MKKNITWKSVVVPVDRLSDAIAESQILSESGIMQVVFLQGQEALAAQWDLRQEEILSELAMLLCKP